MVSPNLTTFNHGGYGATPKPVFDAQLGYMREMEADIGVWMNGTLRDVNRAERINWIRGRREC